MTQDTMATTANNNTKGLFILTIFARKQKYVKHKKPKDKWNECEIGANVFSLSDLCTSYMLVMGW